MAIATARPVVARSSGPSTGADLLRSAHAAHALAMPGALASGIASGTTTRWTLNAAQTLVVASATRLLGQGATAAGAFDEGRIAASTALTAVHATGATPLFARLTLAGPSTLGDADRQSIVDGVAVAMNAAAAVLATVDLVAASVVRIDVVVTGVVRPDRIHGPSGVRPGDALILTGRLGDGIYAVAQARGRLADDERRAATAGAVRSHAVGIALGTIRNVHAVATVGTDGLVAAILAMIAVADEGADCDIAATISAASVPALPRALVLARAGAVAAESSRNWNRDGARVALADAVMPEMRSLLTDPVTSGALLIACKADSIDRILGLCRADGGHAAVIGSWGPNRGAPATRRAVTIGV